LFLAAGEAAGSQSLGRELRANREGGRVFDRILLAVDGSAPARRATEAAAELARRFDAEVLVLHVRELEAMGKAGPIPLEASGDAANLVNDTVAGLQQRGINAKGEAYAAVASGVAPHIIATAKVFGAGVIVMGTRGMSDFAAMLVGSVAHKVIHHAECPVLVTR
jgi:nucleotide-binding universal stress UspA family protein